MTTVATTESRTPPTGPLGPSIGASSPTVWSFVLLALRVLLGGIFCFAATVKLSNPQTFWEAIHAFKADDSEEMALMGTHILPWVEMFAGVALILGFWTRAAATIIAGLMLLFIWAVIGAIHKGLAGVPCSCFGVWHLVCTDGVGWCKVKENSVLTAIAATLICTGGGKLALDRALAVRRATRN